MKEILACELKKGMILSVGEGIAYKINDVVFNQHHQGGLVFHEDGFVRVFCEYLSFPLLISSAEKVVVDE